MTARDGHATAEGEQAAGAPALEIEALDVSFTRHGERLPVLRDVSLRVAAGEAYGLVGESGCGKTTVALTLMRYLPRNGSVDRGAVRVAGEDVYSLDEEQMRARRGTRMAMVYQDPASALNPSMRVGDQVAEVYRTHLGLGAETARERARASLERVAMPDPAHAMERYPFQLSGGQQQRVVIAMALAGDPTLLVLDEPTTGLDATVEAEVLDLIAQLRGTVDAAILLITHNLGLVARMCERVGVMYYGRMVEEGPARHVFTDPRHPYTMGLLRCVPRFGMRKGSAALVPIPGSVPPLGARLEGCVFAPRCELARPDCVHGEPALAPLAVGASAESRRARCLYPERVPEMLGAGRRERGAGPGASGPAPEKSAPEAAGTTGAPQGLVIDDLRKVFREGGSRLVAVDDVSLEIGSGETLGLVGESGSGKTTLARAVAGLIAADGGRVVFLGSDLAGLAAKRPRETLRAIQMVFQNPDATLNPSWTTSGILRRAVRRLSGLRGAEADARVDALARDVGFEPSFLDRHPDELSGGQKQRVAIARAFAGSPDLVVCDEPASALDVSVQATILNLLDELQREQRVAYLFISHDLAVVRYLADRIAVMYLAWLMEVGDADAVFTPPQHPYTEALTSSIPTLDFDHPRRRIPLRGSIPSLADPPPGCRFQTRCPRKLGPVCETQEPPWRDAGDGHLIRCHIELDELVRLQQLRRDA
jgi:peptide/nickel transport system ATP-binding protein